MCHTKSLYRSPTGSHIYGTWANFGLLPVLKKNWFPFGVFFMFSWEKKIFSKNLFEFVLAYNRLNIHNHGKYRSGMAASLKSAVGLICIGHQLEQKTAQKACAVMSFLSFTLNKKCWWWRFWSISNGYPNILMYSLSV